MLHTGRFNVYVNSTAVGTWQPVTAMRVLR